jgi:hypothetical protein
MDTVTVKAPPPPGQQAVVLQVATCSSPFVIKEHANQFPEVIKPIQDSTSDYSQRTHHVLTGYGSTDLRLDTSTEITKVN